MTRIRAKQRQITPGERGNIVQRVLVDGWSAAQAAATFGVDERRIAGWVVAYRRHGMASLRDDAAVESAPRRWLWLLRTLRARLAARLRRGAAGRTARSIRLPLGDGKPTPPDRNGRRSHRN